MFFVLFQIVKVVTTTTTTKRPTTTTVKKIRGCPIKMIPNEEKLKRRNLILQKIECIDKPNLERRQCFPKESFVRYTCKKGYKFENNKSRHFYFGEIEINFN
jgi:hypothetical protein